MDGSIAETRGCVDGIMSHGSEGCLPVHYTCGCRRGGRLEHLFFCYECDEARCGGKCTVDELVSFYCPRCLQNFMSREALDNGNRCVPLTVVPARHAVSCGFMLRRVHVGRCTNCFQCPCCSTSLAVRYLVERGGGTPLLSPRPVSTPAAKTPGDTEKAHTLKYYFSCSFCRWDSRELELLAPTAEALLCTCCGLSLGVH